MADISRLSTKTASVVEVTDDPETTGRFSMASNAGGLLHCITHSNLPGGTVTLRFMCLPDSNDGTLFLLTDKFNSPVELEIDEERCYPLPEELFGATIVLPVVTTEDTAQLRLQFKT